MSLRTKTLLLVSSGAVVAMAAAGVATPRARQPLASSVAARRAVLFDKTYRCSTEMQGGMSVFKVAANPNGQGTPPFPPAGAAVSTGASTVLFSFGTDYKHYLLDRSHCHQLRKRIKLVRAGLPPDGSYTSGAYTGFDTRCLLPGPIVFRARVRFNATGTPRSAVLAVRLLKHGTPIAYVTWSPQRVKAFASPKCDG